MFLNLSEFSSDSFTDQIVKQIRAKIVSGKMAKDSPLPSVRILARESKVSVMTIKNAYSSLINSGFIRPHQGKGYFVQEISENDKRNLALEQCSKSLEPTIETALAENLSVEDIIKLVKNKAELLGAKHE